MCRQYTDNRLSKDANNTIKRMMLGDDYTTKLALNGIFFILFHALQVLQHKENDALWTITNSLNLPHYRWRLNHISVDEELLSWQNTLIYKRKFSDLPLQCFCFLWAPNLTTLKAPSLLTTRRPLALCKSQNSVPIWVQTALTRISVACTSRRLKHVTAAWAPKDATNTVTAARKDGFSTMQEVHTVYRSVGVQCLRRCSDITCRRFPSQVCGWAGRNGRLAFMWYIFTTLLIGTLLEWWCHCCGRLGELAEVSRFEACFWWFWNQPF